MAKGVAVAGASVLSLMLWGCNITEPPPFDPRAITRADQVSAAAVRAMPLTTLPTTMPSYQSMAEAATSQPGASTQPGSPLPTTAPTSAERALLRNTQVVRMPMREIMQRAAANSHEVRVAGYDPAIAETRVTENEAHYDPIWYSNVRYDKQNDQTPGTVIPNPANPLSGQTVTINVENNNIYTAETGVKQYLNSGGQVQLGYQTQLSDYFPRRYIQNNYWNNELKLQLTQPLLREFGYEVNWARITVARNDQRVSILDFRKALEDNVNELEKDYWQLWEAQREVEVQEELLKQTRELAQVLWDQFINGGKATHVEVSIGAGAVRTREAALVRAKARVGDISDDIKRRMGDPEFPVTGPIVILPADQPVLEAMKFDQQDQVATAMANRLELGQQQIRENSAEVAQQVALNGLYPKLDFVGSVSLQGLSSSFGGAFTHQFTDTHMIYSLGLQLEIPLGNREAWSIVRRAQLQRGQAIEEYKRLVDTVSADVTRAVREVNTSWDSLGEYRRALFAQEDVLTGYNERMAAGAQPLDPEFVQLKIDQQERLAEARRQEAIETMNYNIALGALEKAKGTILRYNNIVMQEERFPWNLPSTSPKPPESK